MSQTYQFQRVEYEYLNSRQQENFNFQKIAGHLADFGFNCIRLRTVCKTSSATVDEAACWS